MNERDELRVIEALQALTGGLTVTEQDIVDAGGELRDRLDPPSPHRRLALVVAAAVALVGVIGYIAFQAVDRDGHAAPPAHQPPSPGDDLRSALQADAYSLPYDEFTTGARPSYQDLAGFWLLRAPYGFTMFVDSDGGWRTGTPTRAWVHGDSTLAGATWTQRLQARGDCVRPSHPWRAALATDGSLHLALNLANSDCTPADNREVWDRVDPGSPVADYLLATAHEAEWQAAPEPFKGRGLYVSPTTGHLLDVNRAGRYRYYDDVTGARLTSADHGELESASGTVSGSCVGGGFSGSVETARIPGVPGYIQPYPAVRINTSDHGCRSITQGVWVKVNRY
jgi:hypothetical protein